MVSPTRAKTIWIKLYECAKQTFTATASQTDFIVTSTPLCDTAVDDALNAPFHRVYCNGVKTAITSITASTKTYVIAAQAVGTIVEIVYPVTLKADPRIQQSIDYATEAKTDDWEELNSVVTTTDLVSVKGSGSMKLLRNNKTEIALIEAAADAGTWYLIAIVDTKTDLGKNEKTILPEVQWLGSKGSVGVGSKQEETFSFTFKAPIETMEVS